MRTEKVSLTLDESLLAEARDVVGSRKLSSYVNHALRLQLQHDRIAGLLADLEEDKGPIEQGVMEEVRKAWPSPEEHLNRRRND